MGNNAIHVSDVETRAGAYALVLAVRLCMQSHARGKPMQTPTAIVRNGGEQLHLITKGLLHFEREKKRMGHGTSLSLHACRRSTDEIGTAARGYLQQNPPHRNLGGSVSIPFRLCTVSQWPFAINTLFCWHGSHPAASLVALF